MDQENIIPGTLPDGSQLNPAGGNGTVGTTPAEGSAAAQLEAMTLTDLNNTLGKQYPSKDAALKSIKDTFSYVGKKKEDIEREVKASIQSDTRVDQIAKELQIERTERFYDRNPQYADPSIRRFIESTGKMPNEVVETEDFKNIFTKVAEYNKSMKLKTVLESNPRLNSSRDHIAKARDLVKNGDSNGVEEAILSAVKDAYGL